MKKKNNLLAALLLIIGCFLVLNSKLAFSTVYNLPEGTNIIGQIQSTFVQRGDTLSRIARNFDVGFYELIEANPGINPRALRVGQRLIIPSQYIIPDLPRDGIIINLAEMRLYYFPPSGHKVMTVPIGIGRLNWGTPLGSMRIVEKRIHPTWFVPDSIRKAREAEGIYLPKSIPPGPNNPLGDYAMRLSKRTYLIHGTNRPSGIGMRATSGCIRLYPEDIAALFPHVAKGTRVRIISHSYKVAWFNHRLFLEVHEPLQEHTPEDYIEPAVNLIERELRGNDRAMHAVDWSKVDAIAHGQNGIPQPVT